MILVNLMTLVAQKSILNHLFGSGAIVESRSWRDLNLKFGPNSDLEVDNLEKN